MSKNIVITGANRGIGLAFATIYQQRGDNVFAICRASSAALDALSVNVLEGIDVADEDSVAILASALADTSIDILINNAGILRDEQLGAISNQSIREQFEINALAPLRIVDGLLGSLTAGSKVALITSRMGSIADNGSGGRYGYRMSKAALNAAGMSLAVDLRTRQIPVGIYHPGYVQTDMVGNRGDIPASEAASRIVGLIDSLSLAETGVFRHSDGQVLPW